MYRKVLVTVDGSEPAAAALREVIKITADRAREIRLVHVVDLQQWTDTPPGSVGDIIRASLREVGEKILSAGKSTLCEQGSIAKALYWSRTANGRPLSSYRKPRPGCRI